MSTPSSSSAAKGLPVGRYLGSLPVAGAAFIALATLDQRETLLPALGLAGRDDARIADERQSPAAQAGAEAAVAAVRALDAAIERAYAKGAWTGPSDLAAEGVAREIDEAARFARAAGEAPLQLVSHTVVSVEPSAKGGFSVVMDETWAGEGRPRLSHLRHRFVVSVAGEGGRVDEMTPILPEPIVETPR